MTEVNAQAPATLPNQEHIVELSIPDAVWTFSTYQLLGDHLHIEHPNQLGTTAETGHDVELRRLHRHRELYISKALRDLYLGRRILLTSPFRLRRSLNAQVVRRCEEKNCFRRDVNPPYHPMSGRETPNAEVGNEVPALVERSRAALEGATEYYGNELMSDMRLGFSRAFAVDEALPDLPLVADALGSLDIGDDRDTLSLVISYRHVTRKCGFILNVRHDMWHPLLSTVLVLCREAGCSRFKLWTDQILSFRKPQATLRWVSSGVLPYTIYPVLYVMSSALHDDLSRMWISIEHLAASFGQGIIHAGESLTGDILPKEWVTTYVDITEGNTQLTWVTGMEMQMYQVVKKLCGVIMCGLLRNKALSWPLDAEDIIDWASTITSTLNAKDIGHTFSCVDCKSPFGYPSRYRMAALLCSASPIYPSIPEALVNEAHPRPNVPAVRMTINGTSWDGFREWVPESCLWGAVEDELRSTRRTVVDGTKAIVTSDGGPRAVAILQFACPSESGVLAAYLLVGLVGESRSRYKAKAVWSKRFWPVDPVQMWRVFQQLHEDPHDGEALYEVAIIVGASSGLDYTGISGAREVCKMKIANVKW